MRSANAIPVSGVANSRGRTRSWEIAGSLLQETAIQLQPYRRDRDICRKRNSSISDNRSSRYLLNIYVSWISPFGQAFLSRKG